MHRFLMISLVAMVACFSMGCAAQAQCLRDNASLHAQVDQQQRDLRDANGRIVVVSAEKAGTTLGSLASEGWTAAVGAFGWASNEAPIAEHQAENAYHATSDKLSAARKCYEDNGGKDAHSYQEYQAIASKCLGGN